MAKVILNSIHVISYEKPTLKKTYLKKVSNYMKILLTAKKARVERNKHDMCIVMK